MATCFVIQGFHKKQDFQTGRLLDLDASYDVIRDAVTDAGLECVRADEIRHSGTIDTPMFEQILNADLVIADLSTYNVNAAYELGVRHALRPRATIIVAEDGFKYPFDFSHIAIQKYTHLGDDIGRREAKRFSNELTALIKEVMAANRTDSPVYTFVPNLGAPELLRAAAQAPRPAPAGEAGPGAREGLAAPPPPGGREGLAPPPPPGGRGSGAAAPPRPVRSIKAMNDEAKKAMAEDRFADARATLLELRGQMQQGGGRDDGLLQMLALATYKSKLPTPVQALTAARDVLVELDPHHSNDAETLGLWGAIHKRLWDLEKAPADLDQAVAAYERGFYIRQDYYNGVNYAYLLNVRADHLRNAEPATAIADWVNAERARRMVLELCRKALDDLPTVDDQMTEDEQNKLADQRYWILATLEEVAVGLGNEGDAARWHAAAVPVARAGWMVESTAGQIAGLRKLLADPPTRAIR